MQIGNGEITRDNTSVYMHTQTPHTQHSQVSIFVAVIFFKETANTE